MSRTRSTRSTGSIAATSGPARGGGSRSGWRGTLADLIYGAVDKWGVPLFVSRGVPSATYVHSAAMEAVEDGRPVTVFCLYDYDAGGDRAFRTVSKGLEEHAPGLTEVIRLGLTREQVADWELPTRPAKGSDPEAARWATSPPSSWTRSTPTC